MQESPALRLVQQVPAFSALPAATLQAIAAAATTEHHPAGATLIVEGEAGDAAYVLAEGAAEVTIAGERGPVAVQTLPPGDLFGELALLSEGGTRRAMVTATSPVRVLRIDGAAFRQLLADHPDLRQAFERGQDYAERVRFLKLAATPFAALPQEHLQRLVAALAPLHLEPGHVVMRQGETGDDCYLLRAGRVEVLLAQDDGTERQIATLGPGTLLGETALLTNSPRNATVRALEPCDLLALGRDDLLSALTGAEATGRALREMLQLRARPRRKPGVEEHPRTMPDGEQQVILKDRERAAYYRLSAQQYFVWQRLDGTQTLRDLAMAYLHQYQAFAPQAIADTLARLAQAGFVETTGPVAEVAAEQPSGLKRLTSRVRQVLEWEHSLDNVDAMITTAYRRGVWVLFTLPGQLALAAVALAGIAAFLLHNNQNSDAVASLGPWALALFIPANSFALFIHELGHAFTTKAFGREVLRGGVGWYWFGPIGFIDTSDMWLAGRWPRIAVSIAGPYADVVLASIAALVSTQVQSELWRAVLWQISFAGYSSMFFNLSPLLEFDGYFILSDYLDRPNLRPTIMAWLGRELPRLVRARQLPRGHWWDLAYGVGSIGYVGGMGYLAVTVYQSIVAGWLAGVLPALVAGALGWLLGGAIMAAMAMGLLDDLQGKTRAA